uniref:Bactericidal permeability-increasing protein n=1 Tax=Anabas testudineus TaxID=64144 RepID=A0A3Q1IE70_ANATE
MLPSVVVLLMLLSSTCGEDPAIQLILTNKALSYGKAQAKDWIQQNLEHAHFPDISGNIDIGLGSVDYALTGITITKCDLPEPSVEFYPDITGFKTSIYGLSIALTGGWSTHYGLIHDSGSFDMAVLDVNVISAVELGKDPDGHLSVSSISCDAQVGDVDVQFHGGASWIFQPFVDFFKERISDEIQKRICPSVEEMIVKLESHLQAMNGFYFSPYLKGEFYNIKTHSEPPFKLKSFTLPEQQGYMVSVGLSEFTLNSASYGYYSAGLLQADINDSMIPPYCPVHLNTTSVGRYIPQLPKLFPGLPMSLKVYAREVPVFSFQSDVVKLGLQGAVKAFAIQPNGTQTPLFTLNVDSDFSGKIWISDGRLKGSTCFFLSEILDEGFVLPKIKQAQLVNSVLKVEEGFMAVFSDVELFLTDEGLN